MKDSSTGIQLKLKVSGVLIYLVENPTLRYGVKGTGGRTIFPGRGLSGLPVTRVMDRLHGESTQGREALPGTIVGEDGKIPWGANGQQLVAVP